MMPKVRSRAARRRWRGIRRVALVIAAPFLFLLFLVSLPVMLPLVGVAQARAEKRKRRCVDRSPCGWCVAPLGAEALARADRVYGIYLDSIHAEDELFRYRMVRDLHACCPRCDAGHGYDETADRFVLLHAPEFARTHGDLMARLDPPATATMAWPWLLPRTASHEVGLTRDSAPMGDGTPREGAVAVPPDVDAAAIGEALLRSSWLASAGGDAAWRCACGPVEIVFGWRSDMPFVRRIGADVVAASAVSSLHIRDETAHDPDGVRPAR